MKPLLKWPGGKSSEIVRFRTMIPGFDRYYEPFFGGGALYFHLCPPQAAVNDLSGDLMAFYRLVQAQDPELEAYLRAYAWSFRRLVALGERHGERLLALLPAQEEAPERETVSALLDSWQDELARLFDPPLAPDLADFRAELEHSLLDKVTRTVRHQAVQPFSRNDLLENLITGLTGGYYLYFRRLYNEAAAGKLDLSPAARMANFYFIREMCYGSMFRYNAKGEFNIPYGGMSYNRKDLLSKVEAIFSPAVAELFAGTALYSMDFEDFLRETAPTERDFLFLDPPYDTEFSNYEGAAFTKLDHARLAVALSRTPAKFLLIIKNTDFIQALYSQGFHVWRFDKQYAYNVRSRNDRAAEHLIVTNYALQL